MHTGSTAPDFALPDETGTERRLSTLLADGPVVLYFYPAAMTSGCTAESCHFRDLAAELAELGAARVGISPDGGEKQATCASPHHLDLPRLADRDGRGAAQTGERRTRGAPRTHRQAL